MAASEINLDAVSRVKLKKEQPQFEMMFAIAVEKEGTASNSEDYSWIFRI